MTEYLALLFTAAFFGGLAIMAASIAAGLIRPSRAAVFGCVLGGALFLGGLFGPWLMAPADCRGDLACEVVSDLEG